MRDWYWCECATFQGGRKVPTFIDVSGGAAARDDPVGGTRQLPAPAAIDPGAVGHGQVGHSRVLDDAGGAARDLKKYSIH